MPLQLDAYYVDRLVLEVIENYDDEVGEQQWRIDVEPQHLVNGEDSMTQQVILSVKFQPTEERSAPYRGEIAGRAFFHVCDEEQDSADSLVRFNGSSILFGLLRGQVAQVTAFARWSTFLMPPVDLVEAFDEAAKRAEEAVEEAPEEAPKQKPATKKKPTVKARPAARPRGKSAEGNNES